MEMIYRYLTGPRFRRRIEAVVERFTEMQADLDRERKAMTRLWAKREEQIHGVVETMAGLYGDLQGIAGRSLQEIAGLEVPLLDGPASEAAPPAATQSISRSSSKERFFLCRSVRCMSSAMRVRNVSTSSYAFDQRCRQMEPGRKRMKMPRVRGLSIPAN
jgi:hypothetical protein